MNYSSGDTEFIPNDELRAAGTIPKIKAQIIKNLDNLIGKYPLPAQLTVYRGMYTDSEFLARLNQQQYFQDKGFISTSRSSVVANDFAQMAKGFSGIKDGEAVMMKINLPKGFKAAPIETAVDSQFAEQREVLLPRNTVFKVTKISRREGLKEGDKRKIATILIEVDASAP